MRIFFIIVFITISNVLSAQLSGNLGIGYNRFSNNYKSFKRTNGVTLLFGMGKKINDLFSLNYGINASLVRGNYFEKFPVYKNGNWPGDSAIVIDIETYENYIYSLSMQYPVELVTTLVTDKIYLLSGFSLNIDNIITFGNYWGWNPEIGYSNFPTFTFNPNSRKRCLGFGLQIGVSYKPTKKLDLYAQLKNSINRNFAFGYIEIGIKYRIFTDR